MEVAISNGSTAAAVRSDQQPQLVSRAAMTHPRVQASTHESFDRDGEDAEGGDDIARAEGSDSGSEEVFGAFQSGITPT